MQKIITRTLAPFGAFALTAACALPIAAQDVFGALTNQAASSRPGKNIVAAVPSAPVRATRGKATTATLTLTVKEGFHINAVDPGDPSAIATTLTFAPAPGVKVGKPQFPKPVSLAMPGFSSLLNVYTGTVKVSVPVTVAASAKAGTQTLTGKLRYQGCNATSCFPPATLPVSLTITVK